jgi:hypothetical protein
MRKQPSSIVLSFALAILSIQTAFSQDLQIGFRGGILLNNLTYTPKNQNDPDPKIRLGYQAAVSLELGFGDLFAVQPEIMFGQHGANADATKTSSEVGVTNTTVTKGYVSANTLEIPVLAKVKFGSDALKFYVLAGPSVGFGLSGKTHYAVDFKSVSANGSLLYQSSNTVDGTMKFVSDGYDPNSLGDHESAFAKTNFNLHMGAGVILNIGVGSLFVDARYILGLSDLSPDYKDEPTDLKATTKSNRISLSAGVMFPLGGK